MATCGRKRLVVWERRRRGWVSAIRASEAVRVRQRQWRLCRESAWFLTFLLPSLTVRGTGMGGHLLRLGCGFSLFQRMMIWNKQILQSTKADDNLSQQLMLMLWKPVSKWISDTVPTSKLVQTSSVLPQAIVLYLWAVFRLGDHLQQLHDWLRLGHQRWDGVDDSGELWTRTDPCAQGDKAHPATSNQSVVIVTMHWF